MWSFPKITVWKRWGLWGLTLLLGSALYASYLSPLPESAAEVHPYSQVGQITGPDGHLATGVLVADRVVLTVASPFYGMLSADPQSEIRWRNPFTGTTHPVADWEFFPGFERSVDSRGLDSGEAAQRNLMVLILDEPVDFPVYEVLNSDQLGSDVYRVVAGMAVDLYLSGDERASLLHATRSGESVFTRFGNVEGRIFHTGDLKAMNASLGAPVFSYYNGLWSIDGLVVAHDIEEGGLWAIQADPTLSDFLETVIDNHGAVRADSIGAELAQDVNSTAWGATELPLNRGIQLSVSPSADADYLHLEAPVAGNYTIESYGELDVSAILLNANLQLITSDDDSTGTLNFRIQGLLEAGDYYLKVSPFSGSVTGDYGVSFVHDDSSAVYLDDGFEDDAILELPASGVSGAYRFSGPGNSDVFRVTVNSPGHYIFWADQGMDTTATLFTPVAGASAPFTTSEMDRVLARNDDAPGMAGGFLLDAYLTAGSYLLAVEARNAGEFGNYTLQTRNHAMTLPFGFESVPGRDLAHAQVLDVVESDPVQGAFTQTGGMAFYRFDLSAGRSFSRTMVADEPVSFRIYDASFSIVAESATADLQQEVAYSGGPGRYYLLVYSDQETEFTLE